MEELSFIVMETDNGQLLVFEEKKKLNEGK